MTKWSENRPLPQGSSSVAIVTGGGQGLGLAITDRFVQEGARVVVCDLNPDTLARIDSRLGGSGRVRTVVMDVTAQDAPARAVQVALDAFGVIHCLVNNAGIGNAKPVTETTDDEWDRFFDINVRSAFRFSREVLPHMPAMRSSIVHVASTLGLVGSVRNAAYAATKSALIGLTRQMAADYGPKGIRVNAVAPGLIETPLTAERIHNNPRFRRLVVDTTPYVRIGTPRDVADAVHFLCSEQAGFIHGHTLVVDGGWSTTNYVPE